MKGRDSYRILKNEATPPVYKIQKDLRDNEFMPPEWEDCIEAFSTDDKPIIRKSIEACEITIIGLMETMKSETWTVVD